MPPLLVHDGRQAHGIDQRGRRGAFLLPVHVSSSGAGSMQQQNLIGIEGVPDYPDGRPEPHLEKLLGRKLAVPPDDPPYEDVGAVPLPPDSGEDVAPRLRRGRGRRPAIGGSSHRLGECVEVAPPGDVPAEGHVGHPLGVSPQQRPQRPPPIDHTDEASLDGVHDVRAVRVEEGAVGVGGREGGEVRDGGRAGLPTPQGRRRRRVVDGLVRGGEGDARHGRARPGRVVSRRDVRFCSFSLRLLEHRCDFSAVARRY
mmetsp:Transcript_7674/g.22534  ORF Transcript_7674/g.22534 Transcript_7674/m.22534 type:complete len:256 (-) Transcript_7674:97-864(-)